MGRCIPNMVWEIFWKIKEMEGWYRMDLRKICCEDGRWINLAQDCVQ
jgi:hypothetical protein